MDKLKFHYILFLTMCFIAFLLLYILIRMIISYEKVKRVTKFSFSSSIEKDESFTTMLLNFFRNLIKKNSIFLRKLKIFDSYAKKYEQYRDKEVDGMFFISIKFVICILFILLYVISTLVTKRMFNPIALIAYAIVGFLLTDIILIINKKRYKKALENDLLKAVIIMDNAFKSNRSIIQAIELVTEELKGPMGYEFKKMFIDLTYGLNLEVAFERFAKRVNLEEAYYMASSLVIINKTGGDIVKVFASIQNSFFERKKLEDELRSATAMSNLVFRILVVIPIALFVVIYMINSNYFVPFITTHVGRLLLFAIIVVYVLYILVIKKITKLKR